MATPPFNYREISKTIATPLYVQVAQQLYREIMSGKPPIGSAIPPETELVQRFGVSRITVRKAVSLLLGQGLLSRQHGRGTFVEARPIDYYLDLLRGTPQVPTTQGRQWHSRVVTFADATASAEIGRILDLKHREKVRRIRRIDYSEAVPVAVAEVQLPLEVARHLTREDVESRPVYSLLRANAGIAPDFAIQTICAAKPSPDIAADLEIEGGEPIMIVERTVWATHGRPIEYSQLYFRADAIRFSVHLKSGEAGRSQFPVEFREHRTASE